MVSSGCNPNDESDLSITDVIGPAPCFGADTKILTALGPQPIDDLKVGDRVWTRDSGLQPIRGTVAHTLPGFGGFAPVVFDPGALHNNTELTVSQDNRLLLSGPIPGILFGQGDLMIAAKRLCGLPGVALQPTEWVTYHQISFDSHQVIYANGMLTECCAQPVLTSPDTFDAGHHKVLPLFPSLSAALKSMGATAALSLNTYEVSRLRAKMAKRLH